MQVQSPLLNKNVPNKSYFTPQMTPLHRYNMVIDCYNMPCNMVNSIELQRIPEPQVYEFIFKISTHLRGKICFVILCVLPFVNIIPFLLSAFFAYVYWASLKIHERNLTRLPDPFKKMTFNPEVCFNMGCDYYFFTIELKQLEPEVFITNYQENVSERLKLRKERGKTSIMIYNTNFWASYNYLQKWKVYHYSPLAFSLILATIFNAICILLLIN